MKNMGGGGFEGKALYFCVGGGVAGLFSFVFCCCCCFFFQSSGQFPLAFEKMCNFLQVMVLLKKKVCSKGICWNEKKSSYF